MKITFTFLCTVIILGLTGISSAQTWVSKTGMGNNTRHHPVTWSLNGFGYSATGTVPGNNPSAKFERYDPVTDSWTTLPNFPGPARSFSIGGVYNGEAYLGFGAGFNTVLNDLWKYNPNSESWQQLSSCPCAGRQHPTFTVNENYGKIYVGKGNNATGNLGDWWEYDIASDTWTQMPDFPGSDRHHPYHFSIGDYSYTGLGHDTSPEMAREDWYRFDPLNNTWSQMASAPEGRIAGTQFEHGGKGFVLSGDGDFHQATPVSIFWMYDPDNDEWTVLNPHPGNSVWAPGSFVINDTVYFFGGVDFIDQVYETGMWAADLDSVLNTVAFEKIEITLYPNPAINTIYLNANLPLKNSTVSIFDMQGRLVKSESYSENIDVSSMSTGVYILEVLHNNQKTTMKFVKK